MFDKFDQQAESEFVSNLRNAHRRQFIQSSRVSSSSTQMEVNLAATSSSGGKRENKQTQLDCFALSHPLAHAVMKFFPFASYDGVCRAYEMNIYSVNIP
jgi:hypothetical protein